MRSLEDFLNWLTDMDSGWWPLLHLRPQKNQDIDNRALFKITLCFGLIPGVGLFLLGSFGPRSVNSFIISIVAGWIAFFLIYKVTCAAAWNRRARRLRSGETE